MRKLMLLLPLLIVAPLWAQPADLMLYAPLDGSGDAAFARGDARQQGGLLTFVPGLRGSAVSIISDLAYPVPGNFSPEAGTVALWLRPHWAGTDAVSHHVFCLYGQRDIPHAYAVNRFNLVCSGGRCGLTLYTREEGKTFSIAAPVDGWKPDEWHHVAITWSGINSGQPNAELRLYLDGAPAAAVTGKQIDVGPTNDVMAFGRDQDASPDYADADFDEVFVYSRALTDNEIAEGVRALPGVPYETTATAPHQATPAGWWNSDWPYRAEVTLPPAEQERRDVFVQSTLRPGELSALGAPGMADLGSVRVVGDNVSAAGAADYPVLASRLEDDLVQWRAPGVIPAGSARRFWVYYRPIAYSYPQPLVAQRVVPAGQTAPSALAIPDYATITNGKGWDFDDGSFSGIDQWGNKPEYVTNKKVENGILSMDVNGDPWFIWGDMWGQVDATKQKIAVDVAKYPILEMKVRQSVPSAKWGLYGRVGNSSSLLYHEFSVNGTGWQRVRIDLRKDARWSGVLSAFRIDCTNDTTAHVEFDWVRLLAVTPVAAAPTETIGWPTGVAAKVALSLPKQTTQVGAAQEVTVRVSDAAGKPVAGQPVIVGLGGDSGGTLAQAAAQRSLILSPSQRRGLTDANGQLTVSYSASKGAADIADTLTARCEFTKLALVSLPVKTVPGPAHHYRLSPTKVVTLKAAALPLAVSAQLVDEFDNPVKGQGALTWSTDGGGTLQSARKQLSDTGLATATWTGDEAKRWVYHVRVADDQGLTGESAAICLIPSKPRTDPVVIGPNGYFRKGKDGAAWVPLGGFYANWVGLPADGEEGRRVVSFVEATEEQTVHWLEYLASQGVTSLRFMLRAHTPRGMEPMDVIGRVNMPLFAKVLRYMDLARKHDIRFMLTIHEDYVKPAYFNQQALETFCIPQYAGEDLYKLPPFQRRFIRDRKLIGIIGEKYTDPDIMACQDQYTRQLIALLKDNPQLFSWEFENEMVDCPQSWAQHMAGVIRAADPVTPICASHGGGGQHTADPLWWTKKAGIDFYTYHLYPNLTSTSPEIDYGASVDILTRYGRMAGNCMLGESAGDEWNMYPAEQTDDRGYLMRDIIWFSLVNGNPGCYFWNARGKELEGFRLANKICGDIGLREWQRVRAPIAVVVNHPWEDDKYYRSPAGRADYAMMGRYTQHYLNTGEAFDYAMSADGYAKTTDLTNFAPVAGAAPLTVPAGWQVATAQSTQGEGLAYVRNVASIRNWLVPGRVNLYMRERKPAPLALQFHLPAGATGTATDLDTGAEKPFTVAADGQLDLGTTDHDWAVTWKSPK